MRHHWRNVNLQIHIFYSKSNVRTRTYSYFAHTYTCTRCADTQINIFINRHMLNASRSECTQEGNCNIKDKFYADFTIEWKSKRQNHCETIYVTFDGNWPKFSRVHRYRHFTETRTVAVRTFRRMQLLQRNAISRCQDQRRGESRCSFYGLPTEKRLRRAENQRDFSNDAYCQRGLLYLQIQVFLKPRP